MAAENSPDFPLKEGSEWEKGDERTNSDVGRRFFSCMMLKTLAVA